MYSTHNNGDTDISINITMIVKSVHPSKHNYDCVSTARTVQYVPYVLDNKYDTSHSILMDNPPHTAHITQHTVESYTVECFDRDMKIGLFVIDIDQIRPKLNLLSG